MQNKHNKEDCATAAAATAAGNAPWGGRGPEPGGNVLDVAAAARIAVSPTRTMEQRGTGDGGNKEEVDDHAIGEEMTATATAADGRPFLGATAG